MVKQREQEILSQLRTAESRQQGFMALMELYQQQLYWHVRRLVVSHEDAEDVVQEAFINVYRAIESFKGESSLKTWIYRIATNGAIQHLKRRRVEVSSYDENDHLLRLFESESQVDFESVEAKLQRAILSLPEKQRIIFNLRYFDELEYSQIAEITGSNLSALKANYHYAKRSVTDKILKEMED